MDFVGLIVHLAAGIGSTFLISRRIWQLPLGAFDATVVGAVGGMLGGQIVARSMSVSATHGAMADLGTAGTEAAGAGIAAAALALFVGYLNRRFGRA
ncbi:MAG: hypothetical protein R3D44_08415 [Hyphomicrobiaceae bacterium]